MIFSPKRLFEVTRSWSVQKSPNPLLTLLFSKTQFFFPGGKLQKNKCYLTLWPELKVGFASLPATAWNTETPIPDFHSLSEMIVRRWPGRMGWKVTNHGIQHGWYQPSSVTPRKFNIALKVSNPKRKLIFQPSFFRGYVKFRGCIAKTVSFSSPPLTPFFLAIYRVRNSSFRTDWCPFSKRVIPRWSHETNGQGRTPLLW